MLDLPSSSGFSCFIIYNLAGLWVYIWWRNEPPWCPVLFVCEMGWTATQLALIWACRYQPLLQPRLKWNIFFIRSAFSVFNIKFIRSVFWISEEECILTVKCCDLVFFFYTLDMNLTQLLLLSLYKFLAKKFFPYLFVRRRRKNYNNTTFFFAFLLLLFFFQCCGIFNFGYCQFCCVTLSSRAFFDICKWSKNACPTFLKKICILRVWM